MKKPDWKQILKWGGTLVSVGLFIWLLTRLDWQEAWAIARNMPIYTYGAAIFLLVLGQCLNSVRWYTLLRAQDVRITPLETFKIHMGGTFASNFLPSTIGGDSLRLLAVAKITHDQPLSLASVILDRLVNLIATFTLVPFSIGIFRSSGVRFNGDIFGFLITAVFQGKLWNWIKHTWEKYVEIVRRWLQKPASLGAAFVISWISRIVILGAVWVLSRGVGMHLTLWQVVGVNTVSYFVTLLPITISGYGLRELTLTTLYTMLGATLEQATALTIITRLFSTMITLPGVIWMQRIISETRDIKKETA
ncbi:MAG TPA: lysylphosphatidylglycerol synthase transmembrane domain-containing protein [Anaerolineaceae bacterium]|nr:lysylphosphatidylglycerol synthase transmembrane domain-containing protein [Anaerolineaceae bacterium]